MAGRSEDFLCSLGGGGRIQVDVSQFAVSASMVFDRLRVFPDAERIIARKTSATSHAMRSWQELTKSAR